MSQAINRKKKKSHMIKVAMVGDPQIGKTSLMVKYVEGKFNEDYIQTLGVNFMEKTIELKTAEITFSIWDLGGQREYMEMMPLVCNEAVALLFMFDLSRPATLASVRQWYMEARKLNQVLPLGTYEIKRIICGFYRQRQHSLLVQSTITLRRCSFLISKK